MSDLHDDVEDEVVQENAFLEMSDEEILNYNPSQVAAVEEVEEQEDEPEEEEAEEESSADPDDSDDEDETNGSGDSEEVEASGEEVEVSKDAPVIDYKAEYERLTKGFKANGKDIVVSNMDDAIALMQMGANYNKKMAALKPNLKLLKLLENNKLLDENKLSYLIDLDKKNPAAITKLIKDSGIDPLDVDVEKDADYKPSTYTVDDREMELDAVLEELKDTATYNSTLDIVGNKWDGPSKQVVADNPQLLKIINDHVARGIYPIISKEIERERMFGRLTGMSDLEAYRLVGDAIDARGGFKHLVANNTVGQKVVPPPKKVTDPALIEKTRAASSTQKAAPSVTSQDFNPLGMSDEEFSKLVVPKYL